MGTSEAAVLYALNSRRLYWKLLDLSLQSLRRHDPEIDVYVYVFGKPPAGAAALQKRHRFRLVRRAAVRGRLAAWTLKWRCMGDVPARRLLALDVDTFFHGSPRTLLKRYDRRDFYARKDLALGNDEKHGPLFIRDRLNGEVYEQVARSLGAKAMPVFNGSAMIWNHGSHRLWKKQLPKFKRLAKSIQDHNAVLGILKKDFFADEVAGSLCLGLIKGLRWGFITSKDVTWYSETRFRMVRGPGLLMHVSTAYAKDWARRELGDPSLARELGSLGRADGVRFHDPQKLSVLR